MKWFVDHHLADMPQGTRVLDVGSFDVNGTYRPMFDAGFTYTGLDIEPGPNVDIAVAKPYRWREFSDDSFDVVISRQALEHIEFPWVTAAEMVRVMRQGGLLCIIAPRGFGRHRYPVDCYRYDADGLIALAKYCGCEVLHASTDAAPALPWDKARTFHSELHADSMLICRKPYQGPTRVVDLDNYTLQAADLEGAMAPFRAETPTRLQRLARKLARRLMEL
jgi:SAM-dependent methyltransferase